MQLSSAHTAAQPELAGSALDIVLKRTVIPTISSSRRQNQPSARDLVSSRFQHQLGVDHANWNCAKRALSPSIR